MDSQMAIRDSMACYPRVDTKFKGKKSINFDMMRSNIYTDRDTPKYLSLWKWVAYFFIGVCTGIVAFLMEQIEQSLVRGRNYTSDWVMT